MPRILSSADLHDYQGDGIDFLLSHDRGGLFAGMGLGKTAMTLTATTELMDFGDIERQLIIAPKRVATSVWRQEAKIWTHTKHLKINAAVGTPKERRAALLQSLSGKTGICTINPENLEWMMKIFKEEKIRWPFDSIVFDEFSMFKHHKSTRSRIMHGWCCDRKTTRKGIATVLKSPVDRVWGLTATPASSGLENLFSQIKMLDSGQRLGTHMTHFRNAFMRNVAPPGVQWGDWKPQEDAEKRIYRAIADITKVMRPCDYLDMPELVQNDILVEIPQKVRTNMKVLERDFLLELEDDPDKAIVASNGGALCNKLLQYSNGAAYVGDPSDPDYEKKWEPVHDSKLQALAELDEITDRPMLVAYWFQSDLERIKKKFPKWTVLDKKGSQIDDWNEGKIHRLIVQPASAAWGVNLQYGGNVITMFSMFWSLEIYLQFIARLWRQGQDDTVSVNRILVRDSIEQRVATSLKDRAIVQDDLLEYLSENGQ